MKYLLALALFWATGAFAQQYTVQHFGDQTYVQGPNGYNGFGQRFGQQYYYQDNYGQGFGQSFGNQDYYQYTPRYTPHYRPQ